MSFTAPQGRSSGLEVKVSNGLLTISIGLGTLMDQVEMGLEYRGLGSEYRIVDDMQFLFDIKGELEYEEDDGTTPIHRLFEHAALQAIENGSEAIEEIEE